jgi:uncharacterized protein
METAQSLDETVLTAEDISRFLRLHPTFFEEHASLLADIVVPSPHGSGAISLTERQQLAQRDKIRVLEVKLAELIEFAKENDATSAKVHAFSLKLLSSVGLNQVVSTTENVLQQDFNVSQVLLRVWQASIGQDTAHNIFTPVDDALSDWVISLRAPYCGALPEEIKVLCDAGVASCCVIPLNRYQNATADYKTVGMLILGAPNDKRFKTGMGSLYLGRIGDLVSAAVAQAL